jgi:hypothetical protein
MLQADRRKVAGGALLELLPAQIGLLAAPFEWLRFAAVFRDY